jgi:hypothetical protein|tara:strand:- start:1139 stop:1459 length:321 start_codon:yes stop_codon:yes gene_type:complete
MVDLCHLAVFKGRHTWSIGNRQKAGPLMRFYLEQSMLLKYLNQLEQAVKAAAEHPDTDSMNRCADCVATLDAYLDAQMEPVQRRGRELMDGLIPSDLQSRVCQRVH